MRFDEASARYAEFGPFHVGCLATAAEILSHCRVGTWELGEKGAGGREEGLGTRE
jgi:hypothetical protein